MLRPGTPHPHLAAWTAAAALVLTTACSTLMTPSTADTPDRYETQQLAVAGQTLTVRAYERLGLCASGWAATTR